MAAFSLSSEFLAPPSGWPTDFSGVANWDERGLCVGAGTRLVRIAAPGRLALEADAARCVALLSVLARKSLGPEVLRPIEAAAAYWAAGDKALANLRLIFSGLPRVSSPVDAACVGAAAWCLDQGLAPRDLMKALDLDPSVLELRRFDPNQPRVPAGSGHESGRWTDETDDAHGEGRSVSSLTLRPLRVAANGPSTPEDEAVQVAADDPLVPGGINVVPHQDIDPLDPQGLNAPLSLAEQQAIANTVNMIRAGKPEDLPVLNPHEYKNLPSRITGAVLPPNIVGYTTYYVRSAGAPPGTSRIVSDGIGHTYYSNNHYQSFYPVDIREDP